MEKNSAIVPTLPLPALGYVRESSRVPGKGQRERIQSYCQAKNIPLGGFYQDQSSTANIPFADRPAGGRLCADLQPGQHVVIDRLDLAFSSLDDILATVRAFQAR